MENRRQGPIKYKELGVQRKTSKETSGLICQSIYHQQGNFYQCGQITTTNFNKNSSGSEHQLDSMI